MHNLYIAEIYRYGTILCAADTTALSSFNSTLRAPEEATQDDVVRYGSSNSSKLVQT